MFRTAFCQCFRLRAPAYGVKILALAAVILLALMMGLVPQPAMAQGETPSHRSYINPFPNGDRYRIVVLGDSMGTGLWAGLYRAFEDDATLEFLQHSKKSTGFVRTDRYDWNAEIDQIIKDDNYHVAVVMFGANEGQSIKQDGEMLKFGTEEWREAYGKRVEKFIKKLRAANIATYWVGLPVMRSPGQTSNAEKLNDVFRERAFINGAKYIDTWDGFVDDSGRYSAFGPDMSGQVKRLRANDGVHFTMRGSLKLAHFVEKELRKDLSLAKGERNIPLAGNTSEQANVVRRFLPNSGEPADAAGNDTSEDDASAATSGGEEEATDLAILQHDENGEITIVRPTITEAPFQAGVLASQSVNVNTTEPKVITAELPGGFTAVATISAVNNLSIASSLPQLPLAQRPYYKVLIQGEGLEPKSGRADDFSWPPS
jgi:hypothetical protein